MTPQAPEIPKITKSPQMPKHPQTYFHYVLCTNYATLQKLLQKHIVHANSNIYNGTPKTITKTTCKNRANIRI